MKNYLKDYLYFANVLAQQFALKHFKAGPEDCYWVADEVGGVFYVNDYFFSMNDIVDYTKYRYTTKKMLEHYEYVLDTMLKEEKPIISIRDYKKI